MLFQRINRSDPEKVFVIAKNSYSTASLTNGQPVSWDWATDADGVGVTKPTAVATCGGFGFAGVAAETIAAGAYGLIQVYGYHSAVRVRTISTTGNGARKWVAVAAGTPLTLSLAAAFALEGVSTASTALIGFPGAFALAAQGSYTTKAIAAFIKAL
jgi:hypothetical protein